MANLTIVVDDEVLRRARVRAVTEGTSVNALLRDCLADYVDPGAARSRRAGRVAEILDAYGARSGDIGWAREDLYQR